MRNLTWAISVGIILVLGVDTLSFGQGFQSTPYAAAPFLRRENLDLTPFSPSNPLDPQIPFVPQPDSFLSQDSRKRDIPNLQTGYELYSGKNWRVGYFTLDYLLPIRLTENSIVFGEIHSELQGYSKPSTPQGNGQAYLSAGGGFRTMLGRSVLLGVNGFYDAARYSNRWLSSGGAGLEWALLLPGYDAFDLNINWYGDLFNEGPLVNNSRDGIDNFQIQAGYSHQLFDKGPDLRLYGTAYKFDDGTGVWGWQTGVELKSANGVLSAKFETAYDPVNDSYQAARACLNIGFQLEKLLEGRNPFGMPERIFSSPRNFNRFTNKVNRHWRHTTHGVMLAASNLQTVTIVNKRNKSVKLYMGATGPLYWGNYGQAYFINQGLKDASKDTPACNTSGYVLYTTLQPSGQKGDQVVITFDPSKGPISPSFSPDMCPWGDCPQTLGEFTLIGKDNQDTIDISLVNGFKYPMEIQSSTSGRIAKVCTATGNQQNINVFPLGCDTCTCNSGKPPWASCQNPPRNLSECKQTKNRDHNCSDQKGNPVCQSPYPVGANYTVYVLPDSPCSMNQ